MDHGVVMKSQPDDLLHIEPINCPLTFLYNLGVSTGGRGGARGVRPWRVKLVEEEVELLVEEEDVPAAREVDLAVDAVTSGRGNPSRGK
jgi:hypothetical protein